MENFCYDWSNKPMQQLPLCTIKRMLANTLSRIRISLPEKDIIKQKRIISVSFNLSL